MAKYTAIKSEVQRKHQKLFSKCGVVWAFSEEQFMEGKKPLEQGDKYVSIGAGGYMPKSRHAELVAGMAEIDKWSKSEVKKAKAEEVILYELRNYECFDTGDIDSAMSILSELGYSEKEVKTVYHKNREFALN